MLELHELISSKLLRCTQIITSQYSLGVDLLKTSDEINTLEGDMIYVFPQALMRSLMRDKKGS